jgi:hypothetical protein
VDAADAFIGGDAMRNHVRALRAALLGFLTLGLGIPAAATTVRTVTVGEMLAGAELVFEGRVLNKTVERTSGAIRTCASFEVVDVIKGPPLASPLELCFSGGSLDGVTRRVHGMVHPRVGEHGVYFVESSSRPLVNPFYGWQQGHFVVQGDARMTSADGRSLLGLDSSEEDRAGGIADGVARGARVAPRGARTSGALALGDFKAQLRDRLGVR